MMISNLTDKIDKNLTANSFRTTFISGYKAQGVDPDIVKLMTGKKIADDMIPYVSVEAEEHYLRYYEYVLGLDTEEANLRSIKARDEIIKRMEEKLDQYEFALEHYVEMTGGKKFTPDELREEVFGKNPNKRRTLK